MGKELNLDAAAKSLVQGIQDFGSYSAQAAAKANGVSAAAQAAQGNFNQASANNANAIATDRINNQYAFNAAQMQMTNAYNSDQWDKAAAWNEMMWERQAEFNRQEAQKQRDWQTEMANTAYQRAVTDMQKAGLNPALAAGANPVMPSGGAASVGGASMSSASGAMASGGLIGANQASEGNYSGQMEYMSGMLGLLSAAISGISSAYGAMGGMGEFGTALGEALGLIVDNKKDDKGSMGFNTPFGGLEIDPYGIAGKVKRYWDTDNGKRPSHGGSHGNFNSNNKYIN